MKNIAALTEDGAFALFFRPHQGGFDSLRVSTPGNLPSKAKNANARGGWMGAAGIDWCIRFKRISKRIVEMLEVYSPGIPCKCFPA